MGDGPRPILPFKELAHYAGDAGQPLHTTVHFDGRRKADSTSPHTGIHKKTDALLGKLNRAAPLNGEEIKIGAVKDLAAEIFEFLKQSHARVERVYQLEKELPPLKGPWTPTPAVMAFGKERFRASVSFTANLYLTAWEQSATVEIPSWHKRN